MEKNDGFDVLRLIEHGNICYISSEYLPGELLIYWLKEGKALKKEELFLWVRDMSMHLMRIYRCQGSYGYGFVNPYCILISEDRRLYYLDMEAKSNEEILRRLSKDPVIHHYFLPEGSTDGRQNNLKEELYGMGKTLQYILSVAYICPELTKREERKLRKFISKCINATGKKEIQDVSELSSYLPVPDPIGEGPGAGKNMRLAIKVGLVVVLLVVAYGVKSLAFKGQSSLVAKDETKQEKSVSEKESNSESKQQGTEGNLEKEALLEQSGATVMKLALNYFLDLDNPGKALNVLEENLQEDLQENLQEEQDSLENDLEERRIDQGVARKMQALVYIIKACNNPEEEAWNAEKFDLLAAALEVIRDDQKTMENTEKTWCLVRGYKVLTERRKIWEESKADEEEKSENLETSKYEEKTKDDSVFVDYADMLISIGTDYFNNLGLDFPTETTFGVNVDLLEKEAMADDKKEANKIETSQKAINEIKEAMAVAYEIKGNLQVAIEEWQDILSEATGWSEREKAYLKLEELYEADGQTDQAINTCLKGLEDCYESWSLRKVHIRLLCSDKGMDRGICEETIKTYLGQYPELKNDEEFKEIQNQYGIKIDGETVEVK